MAQVDPFIYPNLPASLSSDPETRAYFEYTARFLHDIWIRTGGGVDLIGESDTSADYSFDTSPESPPDIFPDNFAVDELPWTTRTVTTSYTLIPGEFVNVKTGPKIKLPKNPSGGDRVRVRVGDDNTIEIDGNGRKINGDNKAQMSTKGAVVTFFYFADEQEWYPVMAFVTPDPDETAALREIQYETMNTLKKLLYLFEDLHDIEINNEDVVDDDN